MFFKLYYKKEGNSRLQMLMWKNTKYFTHVTENRPEILVLDC